MCSAESADYPPAFVRNVSSYNDDGQGWLDRLPALIDAVAGEWRLSSIEPVADLSFNYVARALRNGSEPVILKLSPEPALIEKELTWLGVNAGPQVVTVIARRDAGYLMEVLAPGRSLMGHADDDEATQVIGALIDQLSRTESSDERFPRVRDWFEGLGEYRDVFGTRGPIEQRLIDAAERVAAQLDASTTHACLLHGDFHHGNVLSASREPWVVIDPQGVIGDPVYDSAAMLRNSVDATSTASIARIIDRRVQMLTDLLSATAEHIAGWGFAQTTLSVSWDVVATRGEADAKTLEVARQLLKIFEST